MFNYPISYRELEGRKKMEIRDEDLGVIYRSIVFKVIDKNEIENKEWGLYSEREAFRDRWRGRNSSEMN